MNRKDEHLHLARQQQQARPENDFDQLRFVHHALPVDGLTLDAIDISTTLGDIPLSAPFYLNAMTGGSDLAYTINEKLGLIARELDLMLALGSISAGLETPERLASYQIARTMNPNGFIWANLSADSALEKAQRAQDALQANGLQLHLNLPQELVMPEGDRDFSNWLENIARIAQHLAVPVMVKETGFGMSLETLQLLKQTGVHYVDVSGRGGTSFTKIENARRPQHDFNYLADFGLSTVESLLEAKAFMGQLAIAASGGVRHAFDIVKALALGAQAVGISGLLVPTIIEKDTDATLKLLTTIKQDLPALYALVGANKTSELTQTDLLLSQNLIDYTKQRHLPLDNFAVRSYLTGRFAK